MDELDSIQIKNFDSSSESLRESKLQMGRKYS